MSSRARPSLDVRPDRLPTLLQVLSLGLLLLLPLTQVGCESAPAEPQSVAPLASRSFVSRSAALALALSLEPEGGGRLPDGVVVRRVAKLARGLAQAGATELGSVTLLATHRPLLRALPGGHLQLSRGLLAALAHEDPRQPHVAGLLAHSLARVALGQPRTELWAGLRAAGVARLTSAVAPVVKGEVALAPGLGRALAEARALPRATPESRRVADRLAARMLAQAGYSPQALSSAYARLAEVEARDPAWLAEWAARHGAPAAREREAHSAVTSLGRLPARRENAFELDLTRLVEEDGERAVLEALEGLILAGQVEPAQRLLVGPLAEGIQGTWLTLLIRWRVGDPDAPSLGLEGDLRRLLVRAPDHRPARLLLARLYASVRPEAAREELTRLLQRAPLDAELQLLLGQLSEGPLARRRLSLAKELDVPAGRVSEAATRALGDLPAAPQAASPTATDRRGGRQLIGGG